MRQGSRAQAFPHRQPVHCLLRISGLHAEPYSTGVPCPREGCNGVLVEKSSKRGKIFYSCSNYPQCDYALWDWPIAEPCPECGSPLLVLKNTKAKGKFIACPEKTCKYTRPLEGGSEDDAE
mgnify:CR=1 FL=1